MQTFVAPSLLPQTPGGLVDAPDSRGQFVNGRKPSLPSDGRPSSFAPGALPNSAQSDGSASISHVQATVTAAGVAAVLAGVRGAMLARRRRGKGAHGGKAAFATLLATAEDIEAASGSRPATLDASEMLMRLLKQKRSLVRTIADLPKLPLLALNTAVVVPGVAVLSATLCPQPVILARSLSAALGTMGGIWLGKFLQRAKLEAAGASVGQLLADKLLEASTSVEELRDSIESSRRRFDLAPGQKGAEDFEDNGLCTLYEVVLQCLVENQSHDVGDLPLLQRARAVLCLDSIVIGSAHQRVARRLADKSDGGLQDDEDCRRAVDKLLFLSARMFADDEPEEARMFEMSRVRKAVKVGPKEAMKRVHAVSCTLYEQALERVAGQVSATTAATLTEHCEAFGMSDELALEMNVKTYCTITADVLKDGELTEEGTATLEKAQGVLQISEKAAHNAFMSVAGPKFLKELDVVAADLRKKVHDTTAPIPGSDLEASVSKLKAKSKALGLDQEGLVSQSLEGLKTMIRGIYSEACKAASASRDEAAVKLIDEVAAAAATAGTMMGQIRGDKTEGEASRVTIPGDPTAGGRLLALYLERSLAGKAPEGSVSPEEVITLLELPEDVVLESRVKIGEPRLEEQFNKLVQSLDEDKYAEAKSACDAEVKKLALPEDVCKEAALEAYKAAVQKVSNRIINKEEKDQLDRALDALDLTPTDVRKFHLQAFGQIYEKSIYEAMGRGEVVPESNLEALEKLGDRLGLVDDDAHAILLGVVQSRVNSMMESVREAWEETTYTKEALQQIWKERGKDIGDDPSADGTGGDMGIQAEVPVDNIRGYKLMLEFTKLVDFYTSCKVMKEDADTIEEVYPVTIGKSLEQKDKEGMFGIYAWNAMTCQDTSVRDKWTDAKSHVGGILGLSMKEQEQVVQRMVSKWCNMFIKQKVEENGQLGEEDINILTNWAPMFFGIDKDVTQDLVQAANKSMLQSKALRLLNQQKIQPEDVERLRKDVGVWNMQLKKDLELTKAQLRSLFRAEVVSILEDADLSIEQKQDSVDSSREGFGLVESEAADELAVLLQERCRGCLVNGVADLLQNNMDRAVGEMRRLSLLAEFAEAGNLELGDRWEMDMTMRQRLIDACEASAVGAEDGQPAPNMRLIRQLLGLSIDA
mmetsp:Transcript_57659/g.137145  ORF Transcript_57659/g.137145 Transcript_57659/m.137145 type:complete len:1156 (+) Transcript_57659:58-3525(+)